jgi:hypothetical protein
MKRTKYLLIVFVVLVLSCTKDGFSDPGRCYECSKMIKSDDSFFITEDYMTICPSDYTTKEAYENAVKNAHERGWDCN